MKKILCFIDELGSGGAERQLSGLAVLLKQAGYAVEVFCYNPIYFYAPYLEENGVKLIKPERSPKGRFDKFTLSYKVIKDGGYDVVIAYAPGAVVISSVIKTFFPKINLIVSERTTTQKITNRERIKFNLCRRANHIVPNSYSQTEFIKRNFPFLAKKLVTITNFVDVERFYPLKEKSNDGIFRIIAVARHTKAKNISRFLEAVKMAKEKNHSFRVDWYGNKETEIYKDNALKLQELGLSDCMSFHPATANIEERYHHADAFCLPSVYEGYPNVICEAMSSGLPVICSNVCDNPLIVRENRNGFLFNPYSVEDMANAIGKISALGAVELEEMGRRNREDAIELFSQRSFIDKYIKIIEEK